MTLDEYCDVFGWTGSVAFALLVGAVTAAVVWW